MKTNGPNSTYRRHSARSLDHGREPILRRLIEEYRMAKRSLATGLAHGYHDYSVLTALAQEVGRAAARMRTEITSVRKLRKARHAIAAASITGGLPRTTVLS